jgi:hypothetical protein
LASEEKIATQDGSPARLYASLVGALLVAFGVVGFFYSSSFGSPGEVGEAFGAFAVNGWSNSIAALAGAAGLLVTDSAPRRYSLWLGVVLIVSGIWGFALGPGEALLDLIPVDTANDVLRLVLGALGVGAYLGSPRA